MLVTRFNEISNLVHGNLRREGKMTMVREEGGRKGGERREGGEREREREEKERSEGERRVGEEVKWGRNEGASWKRRGA